MAFHRGSMVPQYPHYHMQDRDRFLRKYTSVELVGGCASHGYGVDRPDLIHVFCVRTAFFETKRTQKSIIPESAKGQENVQAYLGTIE